MRAAAAVTSGTRQQVLTAPPLPAILPAKGNEPDILEPFQFNVAGRADLTQKYSRAVMAQSYNTQPHGIPGNDDYGCVPSSLHRVAMPRARGLPVSSLLDVSPFLASPSLALLPSRTLSSWFVFASLGFSPLAGSSRYFLGSPVGTVSSATGTRNSWRRDAP